ncbi:SusC/RagA family TonB-linked outer membrane protein [Sphingobacterium sp. SYP-B4668]|uniref:SusC/RagA family TonB-linked outer membrane protein n=1 Tax=Sphingobacterium sp. SYP-B4668 TaxID=2996035 RepID=UPI0022DD0C81|nr:TonB-dependent receptor [Sphingobacterium sp. SYP-B4668]
MKQLFYKWRLLKQNRANVSIYVCLLMLLLFHQASFAQLKDISGRVTDIANKGINGASVSVKNKNVTTITDSEGNFVISASPIDTLTFRYIGFQAQEILIGNRTSLTIVMISTESVLEEVAVVGFGTQRKVTVTGAISTISVREMQKVSTPALSNAIAGKLPGIITRQASGEPGYDAAQVFIRGLSTFGNNAPLVLIDGVERDMNQINAQEIESFTILKDASATAVYGVRGANGVILINTKRGTIGKPAINFRTEYAGLKALRLPNYINGGEYASLMNEARIFAGEDPRWSEDEIKKYYDGSDPYLYPNSNWTDAVLKRDTWQTINNLSVAGGGESIQYYTNVGYTLQNGIYKQDPNNKFNTNANIKRYNFRSNVDLKLSEALTMQLGIGGIIQNGNYPGSSASAIFGNMRVISPIAYPILNPDGTPGGASTYVGGNPWGLATQSGYTTQDRSTLQGTFGTRWDLSKLVTPGLSLRGLFSYDRLAQTDNSRIKTFEVKRYLGKDPDTGEDLYSVPFREEQPLGYGTNNNSNRAIYMETQINLERSFNEHLVSGMLLYNQRDYVALTAGSSILNLPYRRQGIAGRATYSFKDRYLAEVNFGYNGSENFPKGRRFGFFPAYSAGWVISNENFWDVSIINNFKIRASSGKVGNDQIGQRFLFLNTINTSGQSYYFGADQQLFHGMEENQIGNPNISWERSTKNNIGVDLGFFNDKITLQIDAFNETRTGILLQRQTVPSVAGFFPWSIPYANIAAIKNKGIDGLIEARNSTSGGFLYSLRGNFTFAKNEVIENDEPVRRFSYLSGKGLPLGQSFAFISEGLFESEEEIAAWPRQTFSTPRPGDVKYKDINGDGIIDAFDQIPVGFPRLPQISFGFGGTVGYKNIDFSIYFTGAARTSVFMSGLSMWPFYDGLGVNNVMREYYDNRWTPENKDAQYPAIDVGNNPNNFLNSTTWMKNGNYLRIRNVEIGYSLPSKAANRLGLTSLRLFLNGMNLYTWDHIKVMDPESNDGTGGYPLQRSINVGLQVDFR